MYVFGSGGVRRNGSEWMRGMGLGFTNPVGPGGVLVLCLGCGGVCVERVGGLDHGLDGWCGVIFV